jgi:hypothetical protein
VSFTGRFTPIPGDLESELQRAFPEVKFQIAEMTYMHWGPEPVNLLVASDRNSGHVLTYLWSLWFTSPTPAFVAVLNSRSWSEEPEFRGATLTLAKLVARCMEGRVGEVGYEPAESGKFLSLEKITVELFDQHNRLWRVMKVHFQRVSGDIAPSFIEFEQTPKSGGATFSKLNVAPNNRLKLAARGTPVADGWLRTRAAA